MKAAGASVSSVSAAINFALSASMKHIWDAMNALQVVIQMPMMKNIKFPGNTQVQNEYIVDIVNFDLVPEEWTEAIEDAVYSRVRESESLNINFEASGIESKLFIQNVGLAMWSTFFYLIIALLSFVFQRVNYIWKHFGQKIYWNGLIRLYLSVY